MIQMAEHFQKGNGDVRTYISRTHVHGLSDVVHVQLEDVLYTLLYFLNFKFIN
jgi:hypothetical protein